MDIVQLSMFDGKVCTKCKEWKTNTAFNRRWKDKDTLLSRCIECNRKYKLEHRNKTRDKVNERRRQYYAEHKDRIRSQQKQAYGADPDKFRDRSNRFRVENREKVIGWSRRTYQRFRVDRIARSRKYHSEHRDAVLQQRRQYWHANAAYMKAKHRHWAVGNQEKIRAARWRHKARKRRAEGSFTNREWQVLCQWFGDMCLACGATTRITIDHVIPLVSGGSNWIANIQPLCVSCNCSKQDKTIDYRDPVRLAAFLEHINGTQEL